MESTAFRDALIGVIFVLSFLLHLILRCTLLADEAKKGCKTGGIALLYAPSDAIWMRVHQSHLLPLICLS